MEWFSLDLPQGIKKGSALEVGVGVCGIVVAGKKKLGQAMRNLDCGNR